MDNQSQCGQLSIQVASHIQFKHSLLSILRRMSQWLRKASCLRTVCRGIQNITQVHGVRGLKIIKKQLMGYKGVMQRRQRMPNRSLI